MPSIRSLTERIGCSKNTVIKAYEELEQRHLVYSIPQSGYYILLNGGGKEHSESVGVIDFVHSNPDPRALPYKEFIHCVSKAGEKYDQSMLWYPNPSGSEELKKEIDKLLESRQIYSSMEIFLQNGMYEKHRKKLIKIYKDKMNWFRICWEKRIASEKEMQNKVKIHIPDSGYYIRILLDESIHSRIICSLLEQQGVLVSDGNSFVPEETQKKEESAIRICISNCSEAEIERGIETFFNVVGKII